MSVHIITYCDVELHCTIINIIIIVVMMSKRDLNISLILFEKYFHFLYHSIKRAFCVIAGL